MTKKVTQISEFLLQFDALKSVNRKTYINGGERVENSAEHSWCSGSIIPDTNLGGKIATINEVSDDQKTTFLYA